MESQSVTKLPSRSELEKAYKEAIPHYRNAQEKVYKIIKRLLVDEDVKSTVRRRLKTFDSYYQKLLLFYNKSRRRLEIDDVIGLRIICSFLGDIEVVKDLLSENFKIVESEYIGTTYSFKEFGYQSLHVVAELPHDMPEEIPYTVPYFEIQVRTKLQDAWAEVEHEIIYKSDESPLNEHLKRKLASLNANLTLADIIFQEIREYQKARQYLDTKRREDLQAKIQTIKGISMLNDLSMTPNESRTKTAESAEKIPQNGSLNNLLFQALDAHSNQQYKRALKLYDRIIERQPEPYIMSIVHNHRGMVYFALSEYEKALDDFNNAIQANPKNARAYTNRGLVYRMKEKYDKALEDFNTSVSIDALYVDGYFNRAQVHYELKNFPQALNDCKKVLDLKPEYKAAQKFTQLVESKMFG